MATNVCVVCKLSDKKLKMKLAPLSMAKGVGKIHVIRQSEGLKIPKTTYHTTSKLPIIKFGVSLFKTIYITKKHGIGTIISYYAFPYGFIGALASKITGKRFILIVIGDDYFKLLNGGLSGTLTRWSLRNADLTLTTGHNRCVNLQQIFAGSKIGTMPNAVDTKEYRFGSGDWKYDVIFINSTGYKKIPEFKNHKTALEIMSRTPEIRYAWIGDPPEKAYSNMEILGVRKDIPKLLNSSRILLVTSSQEGMPSVILEALASGVPVVSSNVGDISSVVENKIEGFLIDECTNTEEYILRLRQLLSDSKTYYFMANNAILKGKEYSYENISKIWGDIIE